MLVLGRDLRLLNVLFLAAYQAEHREHIKILCCKSNPHFRHRYKRSIG